MKRLAGIALLVLGLTGGAVPSTSADTLRPTRFGDPEPGKCKPKDCSLREAVIAATKRPGRDTIALEVGKYRLTIPESPFDPNDSSGGDFDINGDLTFAGKGAKKSLISAEGNSRLMDVQGTLTSYKFRDLTLKKGFAPDDGAAIRATNLGGRLELRRVIVSKNKAATNGGGISFASGELKIVESSIRGNEAGSYGGGLFLPAGSGLGAAEATIRSSTLSGNSASLGGGIALDGFDVGGFPNEPTLDMVNSSVAANSVLVSGGGISAIQGAIADIDNSTIAFNAADIDSTGGGSGGGTFQSSGATFQLAESVLAANSIGSTGSDPQCGGAYLGSGNAISSPSCPSYPAGPNVISTEPIVEELDRNGGPTATMALVPGSAAIGFATGCPESDQRGKPRPDTGCDAGSFERRGP